MLARGLVASAALAGSDPSSGLVPLALSNSAIVTSRALMTKNGGGGNRTPVRRSIHDRVYVRSLHFNVAGLAPTGRISPGQPLKVSALVPAAITRAQPEVWRPTPPYGRRQVGRDYLIRQPVRSYCLQLSSPARVTG